MPLHRIYEIRSKVWLSPGAGGWHFIALPGDMSKEIAFLASPLKSAWGSIRVIATVGKTDWQTSIFPDNKRGAYLLPLKAAVRAKHHIEAGDTIVVILKIVDMAYAEKPSVRPSPSASARGAAGRRRS